MLAEEDVGRRVACLAGRPPWLRMTRLVLADLQGGRQTVSSEGYPVKGALAFAFPCAVTQDHRSVQCGVELKEEVESPGLCPSKKETSPCRALLWLDAAMLGGRGKNGGTEMTDRNPRNETCDKTRTYAKLSTPHAKKADPIVAGSRLDGSPRWLVREGRSPIPWLLFSALVLASAASQTGCSATKRPAPAIAGSDLVGHGVILEGGQLPVVVGKDGGNEPQEWREFRSEATKQTYRVPANFTVSRDILDEEVPFNGETRTYRSWEEVEKEYDLGASGKADLDAFHISASLSNMSRVRSESESLYAFRSAYVPLWKLVLTEKPDLSARASSLPVPFREDDIEPYLRFFHEVGTHLATSAVVGGSASMAADTQKNAGASLEDLRWAIGAGYQQLLSGDLSEHERTRLEHARTEISFRSFGRGGDRSLLAQLKDFDHATFNAWVQSIHESPAVISYRVVGVWKFVGDKAHATALRKAYEALYHSGEVRFFTCESDAGEHPTGHCEVGDGYKLIGGGAEANWRRDCPGAGQLLTASFPENARTWKASSKDHSGFACVSTVSTYAIGLFDPYGQFEVKFFSRETETPESHPSVEVNVPEGYVMTGGGARVVGVENLLVASYPGDEGRSWHAKSKDHWIESPARLEVTAIGVRRKDGKPYFESSVDFVTSGRMSWPESVLGARHGYMLVGGGARVNWADPDPGNLLTASYPELNEMGLAVSWAGAGKDHARKDDPRPAVSPASITVFAIGLRRRAAGLDDLGDVGILQH